ncbi:glycosyl hydrolase family 8 [uncultured Enterococcus sp.]|uniref:glycosyl hydrolase family 8 n=1 Tax=uncultured Enterococcus sp. TaxID=167972 RepID=UPI002587F9C9|nr:glycosyl hydrolase family 8 [uncultured Enterococcus sp.]
MRRRPAIMWPLLALLFFCYVAAVIINIKDNQKQLEKTTYQQWQTAYVKESGNGSYVQTNPEEKEAVSLSEGHGYGMLITMQAAKRGWASEKEFRDFYRYYEHFQLSDDVPLMSWRQKFEDERVLEQEKTNATDGDLDIAYALIEASKQWPDSQTNYKGAAKKLLTAIKTKNYNSTNKLLTVGAWATKESDSYDLIRPSDIIPSYFDAFASFTGDDFWKTLKNHSLVVLEDLSKQHKSGLIPDFAVVKNNRVEPAEKNLIAGPNDGNYGANACRIPWRLASSSDKRSNQILSKMMNFFLKQGSIAEGYTLSGKTLSQNLSKNFSAPVLFAADQKKAYGNLVTTESWVINDGVSKNDYYGDTLTTLITLQMNQK